MSEFPACPRCNLLLDGVSTPRGGVAGNRSFPDRSTGYCVNCHLGMTKVDGVWAATPVALWP